MADTKEAGATGGMTISGDTITVSAQALPPQPKGWPNEGSAPALHDAADAKLDTDGDGDEGS